MTAEDDLIRLAMSGHKPAFEMLVKRTSRLVWARQVLNTRDRALAEDLTQETYLRAWRSIGQLKEVDTFRGWLLKIADSVRLDSIKQAARRKRGAPSSLSSSSNEDLDAPDSAATPSEQAESGELCSRALTALSELPEQYQQVLTLRYLGGAEMDEISNQLALTNGSLRGLLHRGLEMLREKMAM